MGQICVGESDSCFEGNSSFSDSRDRSLASANISLVKIRPPRFERRKLATAVRKAITSYYTEEEQREVRHAAKLQGISMSSFVASATLKEARRVKRL
jgi:hypothetical protein